MNELQARVDVLVLGGGITGLWLLGRLVSAGYSALLLERSRLGGVQTLASQGIIHGGTKYALLGRLTDASQAIARMPGIWRACLAGTGELDLRKVRLLSEHQYLWSTAGPGSRFAGFFAGKAMRGRVRALAADERPALFRHADFRGSVYRLDEPVLGVASLVDALVNRFAGHARLVPAEGLVQLAGGPHPSVVLSDMDGALLRISARRLVLAAGAGNAELLQKLGRTEPKMQRRPLHMLMVRGRLPALYAHCLGASATPRVTVTSHPLGDGRTLWYLGGQIGEAGVERSGPEQIAAGREELRAILPWLDMRGAEWAALRIDRAEPEQPGGKRPDSCFLEAADSVLVAWPTKLAFAPQLAGEVLDHLAQAGISPGESVLGPLGRLPRPETGRLPWEDQTLWS